METHSSVLAWRIPGMGEPGGCHLTESDTTEATQQQQQHTVKGFSVVNEAEVDVFLGLPCFFDDPADVGNLISGSSAFSKTSLNIWKFGVHVLVKRGLESFEHYLLARERSSIVWQFEHSLVSPFFGIGMKTDLFQSCGHC